MTFEEMFGFLFEWMNKFGAVISLFSIRLGDLLGPSLSYFLPQSIQELSLLGFMFNAGFSLFIAWTLAKWLTDIVN